MYLCVCWQNNHAHPYKIWDSIIVTKDASLLTQFLLITFADLKKYQYFYWFAFPAFVSKPAWDISENGWRPAQDEIDRVCLSSQCMLIILQAFAVGIHLRLASEVNSIILSCEGDRRYCRGGVDRAI
jgi:ubiquitin-like modifier-activating enzyme ATG7